MEYKYRAPEEAKIIVADVVGALGYARTAYKQSLQLGYAASTTMEDDITRRIESIDKFLKYLEGTLNEMRAEGLDF